MDLFGSSSPASIVASSTTSYLAQFAPVFLLVGGVLLAMGIIGYMVGILRGGGGGIDFDDTMDDV